LTGEADPIGGAVDQTDPNPLETRNIAMSGTFTVIGAAKGVVVGVGDRTVMGAISAKTVNQKEDMTSFQKEMWIFTIIVSCAALFFFTLAMIMWGAIPIFHNWVNASVAVVVTKRSESPILN
jgi:sodium/potassium-transporting ATPase subunit alpha